MNRSKLLLFFFCWIVEVGVLFFGLVEVQGEDLTVDLLINQRIWLGNTWSDIPDDEVLLSDLFKLKISIENSGDLSSNPLRLYYEIPCYSGYPLRLSDDDLLVWEDFNDHYENAVTVLMPGEILEREINLVFNKEIIEDLSEDQYCISHIRIIQEGVEGEYYEDYALMNLSYGVNSNVNSGCLWSVCDLL